MPNLGRVVHSHKKVYKSHEQDDDGGHGEEEFAFRSGVIIFVICKIIAFAVPVSTDFMMAIAAYPVTAVDNRSVLITGSISKIICIIAIPICRIISMRF